MPLTHLLAIKVGDRLTESSFLLNETVTNEKIAEELKEHVIKPVIPPQYLDGRFVMVALMEMQGLQDHTKADRSGAYIVRQAAKSVVASGLAQRCIVLVSYAIGMPEPLSVFVDAYEARKISNRDIQALIKDKFDCCQS
ncbi:hypothetical protein GH714_002063 [Hevea brasiliensis]|uniref:S-adenosylmethionine synthetase C-terminal domain-containing protein n=1 Tax=Hevea brasiliensis TaxID=3981 RepID=A0A6A6N8N9_HEVBR|nr:hypothetical protein GH714_002063 [Hevea brasiliensis]